MSNDDLVWDMQLDRLDADQATYVWRYADGEAGVTLTLPRVDTAVLASFIIRVTANGATEEGSQ